MWSKNKYKGIKKALKLKKRENQSYRQQQKEKDNRVRAFLRAFHCYNMANSIGGPKDIRYSWRPKWYYTRSGWRRFK